MLKKIFFGFALLILLAMTLWINRVEVVVWAIPKIIKFTQPVAEYKEVVWPEGPSEHVVEGGLGNCCLDLQ